MSTTNFQVPITSALTAMLVTTGRCSRKGLLICALVLLTLQLAVAALMLGFGLAHDGLIGCLVAGVFLWLGTCAAGKRLHDLGISARRILWVALAVVAWSTVLAGVILFGFGEQALEHGGTGLTIAAIGTSVPVFAATIWLHLAPGMPGPNRYGIEPGDSGFSEGLPLCGPVTAAEPQCDEDKSRAGGSVAGCERAH